MAATRLLGIDPGLAIVGFGVLEGTHQSNTPSRASVEDYGIIETPARAPVGERLGIIYDDVHCLVQKFQPSLAVVEKLFFYRMGNTILVAQARGIILLVLAQAAIPVLEFTPAQVKQALTGHGNADKAAVQSAVAYELSLDTIPRPDDAADALALALTAWFQR